MMLFEQPREPPTTSMAPAIEAAPFADDVAQQTHADEPDPRIMAVIGAAHTAARYDANTNGRFTALTQAYDDRNAAVQQATGIKLNNPLHDGYLDEAQQRYLDEGSRPGAYDPSISLDVARRQRLIEIQHSIWQDHLRQAASANPLYADVIGADRPITQDAIGLTDKAQADYARTYEEAGGGPAAFVAGLAGGLSAGLRDPFQLGMLAFGGGELKAASTLGQIFEGAIRQGFVNAGAQAMAEPQVQAWRAERGAESGFVPAAEDVGLAALFGAIPGAGFPAARAALRALRARPPADIAASIGQAAGGDVRAAARVAEHLPPDIAPDLHAAIESARLDRAAMPALPEGIAAEDAADAMRGALRHAEDPSQPLGEVPGLHPEDSPDALDLLLEGRADPATAHAAATRLSDPSEQASVLAEAMRQHPASPQEAATAVSDAMERRAVPEAQAAALGADTAASGRAGAERAAPEEVPTALLSRETNAERAAHVAELETSFDASPPTKRRIGTPRDLSLLPFLAADRGLAPNPELQAVFHGNPFIPGFGRLIREGGRTLDEALIAAKDARYLHDPGEDMAAPLTKDTNDLLDALAREHGGARVHTLDAGVEREVRANLKAETQARAKAARQVARALVKDGIDPQAIDARLMDETVRLIHRGEEKDPLAAYERAIMEARDQYEAEHAARIQDTGALPGYDVPFDAEPASRLGGAAEGERRPPPGEPGAGERAAGGRDGAQSVIPGAERIGDSELAQRRANEGLKPAVAQKDTEGLGLFGDQSRQTDLMDLVPIGEREDGVGMRLVPRGELLAEQPREHALADLVEACKT